MWWLFPVWEQPLLKMLFFVFLRHLRMGFLLDKQPRRKMCIRDSRTTVEALQDVQLPGILEAQRTRTNLNMLRKQLAIILSLIHI